MDGDAAWASRRFARFDRGAATAPHPACAGSLIVRSCQECSVALALLPDLPKTWLVLPMSRWHRVVEHARAARVAGDRRPQFRKIGQVSRRTGKRTRLARLHSGLVTTGRPNECLCSSSDQGDVVCAQHGRQSQGIQAGRYSAVLWRRWHCVSTVAPNASARAGGERPTARRDRRRRRVLQRHPLRRAPRGRPAVATAAAGGAVDRRAPGRRIRGGLHAGTVRPATGRRCTRADRPRRKTACS